MNTDKFKGVVEIEILGELRGFKFGMAAMVQLCRLENTDFKGVQANLESGSLQTLVNLLYAAAVQYAKLYKKAEPTFEDVANWIDHLDGKESEIIQQAFASPPVDPNQTAS